MQSACSSDNTPRSQCQRVPPGSQPKFLNDVPTKAASKAAPTDSATLWTSYNVQKGQEDGKRKTGKGKIIVQKILMGW